MVYMNCNSFRHWGVVVAKRFIISSLGTCRKISKWIEANFLSLKIAVYFFLLIIILNDLVIPSASQLIIEPRCLIERRKFPVLIKNISTHRLLGQATSCKSGSRAARPRDSKQDVTYDLRSKLLRSGVCIYSLKNFGTIEAN